MFQPLVELLKELKGFDPGSQIFDKIFKREGVQDENNQSGRVQDQSCEVKSN